MDLVYIVREGDDNDDLKYSLRSIAKHYPDYKVWIVGYKPTWVENVNYIHVLQSGTKWQNSVKNILTACKDERISDDFILMNDDFFCIEPKCSIEQIGDTCLGSLDSAIAKHNKPSKWCEAFVLVKILMERIGIKTPYYSFEAHLPLKINKKKYLEIMDNEHVRTYMRSNNVLHKRTLYKNYDLPEKVYTIPSDVKVSGKEDNSKEKLKICGWLSVYENQVKNSNYKDLHDILTSNFPDKCKYEVSH